MNEMQLCRWLLPKFRALGCHASRIENAVGVGIPDIHLCLNGQDLWIETKICRTQTYKVPLRGSQFGWHVARARSGGTSYILVLHTHNNTLYLHPTTNLAKNGPVITDKTELKIWCPREKFFEAFTKEMLTRVFSPTDEVRS